MDRSTLTRNGDHRGAAPRDPPAAQELLRDLLASSLILPEDWYALRAPVREDIAHGRSQTELLDRLVEYGLLTNYQAGRIESGSTFGLLLGSYRVLDRLGAGGMGVVYR